MVVPHMLWCESYLQSEGRRMHRREWNKLCKKRKKMCMLLVTCCCMWKRSRLDERKRIPDGHMLLMIGDGHESGI